MNKKQIALIVCGVIMIMVVVYNSLLKNNFIPKNNVLNSKSEDSKKNENIKDDKKENESENEPKDGHVISAGEKLEGRQITSVTEKTDENGEEFKVGKEIEFDDSIYIVNKVERSKEQKNFKMIKDYPMAKVNEEGKIIEEKTVEIDEAGNITNEFSYFIINMTIKNKTDKVLEKNLGEYGIYYYDNNNKIINGGSVLLTNKEDKGQDKRYFYYNLQPHEEFTTDLIYIMWDDELDYNNVELIIGTVDYKARGQNGKVLKVRY
ncbi:hypothetical protein [Clostridium ihumii]|uniref:hypothetical protein n=1 Tax=Clostridium ihumii TaxID=1470356 RepID=UPI000559503E|nr:hypothetical protein [Clostridium ihumii]